MTERTRKTTGTVGILAAVCAFFSWFGWLNTGTKRLQEAQDAEASALQRAGMLMGDGLVETFEPDGTQVYRKTRDLRERAFQGAEKARDRIEYIRVWHPRFGHIALGSAITAALAWVILLAGANGTKGR